MADRARCAARTKYIACNAGEGHSGTFTDRMLMEGDPFCLIEGMAIAAHAVGANHGYIYIRSEYPFACQTIREAIVLSAVRIAPFTLEVRVGAGAYGAGCPVMWPTRLGGALERYLADGGRKAITARAEHAGIAPIAGPDAIPNINRVADLADLAQYG